MVKPIFEREYIIKSYETDKNRNLRILTLMNMFQDMADGHASSLGVGIEFCLQNKLAWIGSGYHVIIDELPKMGDKIKIVSWAAVENKLTAIREFLVLNERGETLIKGSSQWVLISIEKKRPVSLRENLPEYPRVEERAINTEFSKIDDLNKTDLETKFLARFDDIDLNNHVNNAVYPLWATEAVGRDFRLSHTPVEIEVAFKKEALMGEKIMVFTEINDLESKHKIISRTDDRELARVKVRWK